MRMYVHVVHSSIFTQPPIALDSSASNRHLLANLAAAGGDRVPEGRVLQRHEEKLRLQSLAHHSRGTVSDGYGYFYGTIVCTPFILYYS